MAPDEMDRIGREETARRNVDAAENWLRKIIHYELSKSLGPNYLSVEGVIKKELIRQAEEKTRQLGTAVLRPVDTTTFEQAIYLITHPTLFSDFFRASLSDAYPLGREQALLYLRRLKDIRNDVSHGRGSTARQVEQAACYANDLIDSLKAYFRKIGMDQTYDVPMIVRFIDNRGNESHLQDLSTNVHLRILDLRPSGRADLYPGDVLVAEVEVDQSYDESEYHLFWRVTGSSRAQERKARFQLENRHVSEQFELIFDVVSKRDWHRQSGVDDRLTLLYRVLPPRS